MSFRFVLAVCTFLESIEVGDVQNTVVDERCINLIEKTFVNEKFGNKIHYLVAITGIKNRVFYFVNFEFLNWS